MSHESDTPEPPALDPAELMEMALQRESRWYSDGSPLGDLDPARLGELLPGFEILELVGRGGMGAVYRAVQKRLDRVVAIKVLPPEAARDPAFAERFTREARTLARLSHPNIVTIHDFGESEGVFYLVMEYVPGLNLRQLMAMGRLSPEEALRIVPQICDALQFAHEQGVVHRDIKPENVLLDQQGRIHVADFGLARILGQDPKGYTLTDSRQRLGTPHYMAPEQIEDPSRVDHRADIFSLGVVFYELLTGRLPLGRFDPPSSQSAVGPRVDEAVMRSLEKEPERRFQAAKAMKTEVEAAWKEGFEAGARAANAPPRAPVGPPPDDPEAPRVPPAPPPRLCLPAVFGFLWLVVGVTASAMFLVVRNLDAGGALPGESGPPDDGGDALNLGFQLAVGFGALGLLGGPVLGGIALGRIRRAAGRLQGFTLAVFTVWSVPLTVAAVVAYAVLVGVTGPVPAWAASLLALLLAVGVVWALSQIARRTDPRPGREGAGGDVPLMLLWCVLSVALVALLLALFAQASPGP